MPSTLVTIWILWLIFAPLNMAVFVLWRSGKPHTVTSDGKLSGGGLQWSERKMLGVISAIALVGIILGLLHVAGYTAIPIG